MAEIAAVYRSPSELQLTIKNDQPIELLDLTTSLAALAGDYQRYLIRAGLDTPDADIRLYIDEIRSGSVFARLVAAARSAPSALRRVDTMVGYAKRLIALYERIRHGEPLDDVDAGDLRGMGDFLDVITKDPKARLDLEVTTNGRTVVAKQFPAADSAMVQRRIGNHIAMRKVPQPGRYEREVFVWYQARNDLKAKAGDLGRIENLYHKAVKVIFAGEEVKEAMLHDRLFEKAYVVDVEVQFVEGRPVAYKILKVHEDFDLPPLD